MIKNIYKVPGGKMLRISVELDSNKISSIKINGDFFAHPEDAIEVIEKELIGTGFEKEVLVESISGIISKNDFNIFGFDASSLAEAIIGCK